MAKIVRHLRTTCTNIVQIAGNFRVSNHVGTSRVACNLDTRATAGWHISVIMARAPHGAPLWRGDSFVAPHLRLAAHFSSHSTTTTTIVRICSSAMPLSSAQRWDANTRTRNTLQSALRTNVARSPWTWRIITSSLDTIFRKHKPAGSFHRAHHVTCTVRCVNMWTVLYRTYNGLGMFDPRTTTPRCCRRRVAVLAHAICVRIIYYVVRNSCDR